MRGRRSRGERIHAPSITAVISSLCLVLLVSSRCSCCRLDRPTRVRVSPPGSRWAQGRPNAFGAPLRLRTTLRLRGGNAQAELQVQQTIQALQILHDPRETQARRGAAHALCEQIKNGDALCVLMARRLSATEHSDAIRHFGDELSQVYPEPRVRSRGCGGTTEIGGAAVRQLFLRGGKQGGGGRGLKNLKGKRIKQPRKLADIKREAEPEKHEDEDSDFWDISEEHPAAAPSGGSTETSGKSRAAAGMMALGDSVSTAGAKGDMLDDSSTGGARDGGDTQAASSGQSRARGEGATLFGRHSAQRRPREDVFDSRLYDELAQQEHPPRPCRAAAPMC